MIIKANLPNNDKPLPNIASALKILDELDNAFNSGKESILDFSEVKWMPPCSALLISSKIRDILARGGKSKGVLSLNPKVNKYLNDIGFPFGTGTEGKTYVPINHIQKNPSDSKQMNTEANNLMKKIKSKIPPTFGDSIVYIIGELTDNIDQHSNFSFASIMAQYYPTKRYLEVGFFDNGVTIPGLFDINHIPFNSDSDAIKQALWGEVTTKKNEDMRGFGLKSCKKLAEELDGEVYIASRKGILILKSGQTPEFHDFERNSLKGTLLYFRLKTPKKKLNILPIIEPRND